MNPFVGTSGYSYKEWKGTFYPEDLKPPEMLAFYSRRLNSVEINNTFYRMPSEKVLATWAEQVPETFSFVIKASRRITHQKRLKEAEDEVSYLFKNLGALGDRLGAVLFQLPPYLRKDAERLAGFLELLPEGVRAAFEFRHPSWLDEEISSLLASRGLALVAADSEKEELLSVERTADYGYLRLRRPGYDDAALAAWAERIHEQGWSDAYVFFKHEDEGAGPRMARRFSELLAGNR